MPVLPVASIAPPRKRGIELAADQFLDERLRSFRTALSIGIKPILEKAGEAPLLYAPAKASS